MWVPKPNNKIKGSVELDDSHCSMHGRFYYMLYIISNLHYLWMEKKRKNRLGIKNFDKNNNWFSFSVFQFCIYYGVFILNS